MYVLCKLKGTGLPGDPYRCDFPTYTLVAHDPATMQAIADVRPEDVPATCKKFEVAAAWIPGGKADCVKIEAGDVAGWNKAIRKKYTEGHAAWKSDDAVEPKALIDVAVEA